MQTKSVVTTCLIALGMLCLQAGCARSHDEPLNLRMGEFDDAADVISVDIAWVDHRVRYSPTDHYEEWYLEIGLSVHAGGELISERDFALRSISLASRIVDQPQSAIEVQDIRGDVVELAEPLSQRYFPLIVEPSPASLQMTRRFELDDGSAVHIGTTMVSIAEPLPAGVYRIRLKPERWRNGLRGYRWNINADWRTFVLTGIDEDRRRWQRVPWRDLPKE